MKCDWRPVNSLFTLYSTHVSYKVVRDPKPVRYGCYRGCAFNKKGFCENNWWDITGACIHTYRPDRKNVIFKECKKHSDNK